MTANSAEERVRLRLRSQAEQCTVRALRMYTPVLREHTQRAEPPDAVDSYVSVLRNAAKRMDSDHHELLEYASALVELLTNVGGGSQFREKENLIELFEHVTDFLTAAQCSTSDLRLMLARYYSSISNGGDQRLRIIEGAARESRTEDEKLRALLVLAKYHIDVSDYDTAHRYLDECLAVAAHAPTGQAQQYDINTTRGIAYFYSDRALATRYLLDGVVLNPKVPDEVTYRSTASALHHLGRIKMIDGEHRAALALIVLAQHYKSRMPTEGTQFGYYHLRLGEMLVNVGNNDSGMWHLQQAGTVFHGVRERSNAEAQLNSILATVAAGRGDYAQAVLLLTSAIRTAREDRFPRGELLFRYQLTLLYLKRGALIKAVGTAAPAVRAWRAAHLGGWRWILKQAALRASRRRTGPPPNSGPTLSCPCPAHDAVSTTALLHRSGIALRGPETAQDKGLYRSRGWLIGLGVGGVGVSLIK